VEDFLKHYQDYLKGDYVLDLAQLKEAVTTVTPLLEAHEETQPYAAWLRSRLDYFEAAQEMQALATAPVPGLETNALVVSTETNLPPPVGGDEYGQCRARGESIVQDGAGRFG